MKNMHAALDSIAARAQAIGNAFTAEADIAKEDPQKAIDNIHGMFPLMPILVDVRPMYEDSDTAVKAGKDPSVDAVESLLGNAFKYVVREPMNRSGLSGSGGE